MKQTEAKLSLKELGLKFKETRKESDFNALHKRIKTGLYQYAYRILKDHSDASEVVTQTMTKVWLKIDQYNTDWHISTWIYTIAYNNGILPILHRRKEQYSSINISQGDLDDDNKNKISKVEYSALGEFIDDLIRTETEDEYDLLLNSMLTKIASLPDNLKGPLSSRYFDNLSYDEIGEKYNINLQTVKNRIFKAKSLLKEELKEQHKTYLS